MDGYRAISRGQVDTEQLVDTLSAAQPVNVLTGPIDATDIICIRKNLFVELTANLDEHHHPELGWYGMNATDTTVLAQFLDVSQRDRRAWTAAHAFLWLATRRHNIEEALLVGSGTEPLRFLEGHIRPVPAAQRYSED